MDFICVSAALNDGGILSLAGVGTIQMQDDDDDDLAAGEVVDDSTYCEVHLACCTT